MMARGYPLYCGLCSITSFIGGGGGGDSRGDVMSERESRKFVSLFIRREIIVTWHVSIKSRKKHKTG